MGRCYNKNDVDVLFYISNEFQLCDSQCEGQEPK